jgi:cystathionine beta-synthase
VLSAEPPVVMGEVLGSVDAVGLLELLASGEARADDAVESCIGPRLGLLGIHESIDAARGALAEADAVLVARDGKPVSVLSRNDLLAFLSS